MEIQINRNELYEALCARLGYAQKKAELNAGKKYEQKWKESAAHVKEVIAWILDHDRYTINLVAHDADQAAALPVGELSPIEVKMEELSPMTNEDLESMTADLPLDEEPLDEIEEAKRMEAEKPLPSIPYVYVPQDCQEHLTEGCPAHFIFSNELRKAAREAIEDARREQCVPSMHEGLPVERLAAALITAACVGLSVSSNGHIKAINAAGFERLFDDGPHDEELGAIKCMRDGEGVRLSITRGAMFDAFFGKAAEYYGVATREMRHRVVENVQGLRCPETYPNYLLAVKLPCLDCGDLDSVHITMRSNTLPMPSAKCLNDECFAMCKIPGPLEGFAKRRMAQATKLSYERLL